MHHIFGYTKDKDRLLIDGEQSEPVREAFVQFATRKASMKQTLNVLLSKGCWDQKSYHSFRIVDP